MKEELDKLKAVVNAIYPLKSPDFEAFSAIWQPFEAKRKVILTHEGTIESYVYFVLEGVQRAFAVDKNGRETTLVFSYPPSFSGIADSFLLQKPSKYYLETLTPSRFLRTTFHQLDELMLKNHAIERLMRLTISQTLSGVLERQIELQSYSAEERFRTLLTRSGHVLTMIPHKYLASYLGMDATNFSKLLANVKI
ncbi:MAG: Crp/Fnr family transcriptional regulator [Saprospiraceae bacterium]|nr:Crp/Fnr family transcriptional regulator [Saprospiraceae bacterium]